MNEKTFNKVKNAKSDTSVSYDNAVMIAFGLQLTFDQMVKFVNSSGKGFRNYGKREEIVREFFENENYNKDKDFSHTDISLLYQEIVIDEK